MLEEPARDDVEIKELDLVTGRVNPVELGDRWRSVWLHYPRSGDAISSDEDDDAEESKANGEFNPCGVCGQGARFGRTSVQDHQTKGDQPFQALVSRQIEVQPPGTKAADEFAPLRGRKVLAFSDSRQVAARLAPNLQDYSMRDVIRPVVLKGWTELRQTMMGPSLSLEHLYLSSMVGAKLLGVRLRPERVGTENFEAFTQVAKSIDRGALTDPAEMLQLFTISDPPPQSLLQGLVATLTHPYYGFTALGLASLRERANLRDEVLVELPDIPDVATTPETKLALVRLWIAQWTRPGIWFTAMSGAWRQTKVRAATGKFQSLSALRS